MMGKALSESTVFDSSKMTENCGKSKKTKVLTNLKVFKTFYFIKHKMLISFRYIYSSCIIHILEKELLNESSVRSPGTWLSS